MVARAGRHNVVEDRAKSLAEARVALRSPQEWPIALDAMNHTYNPVGACIYCGSAAGPLQDEHIVAYGLGGKLILPKSSCAACATTTSQIEQHCLRGIFLPARAHLKLPSRRNRPKTLPVDVEIADATTRHDLPIANHPGYLFSFAYDRPYVLDGFEPMRLRRGGRISTRNLNEDQNRRLDSLKGKVHLPAGFNADLFARMLAKIALSYAVAERYFGTFRPLVRDAILNSSPEDMFFVVGGITDPLPGAGNIRFAIEEREVISTAYRRRRLLVVNFQLFADYDMPTYQIVVGEL